VTATQQMPQATSVYGEVRHDWSRQQVLELFALPFNDLLFTAQTVHRVHFDPNRVQVSTLCSIKTGACPEDCSYCPQSARYDTGLEREKLMKVEKVLEEARAAKIARDRELNAQREAAAQQKAIAAQIKQLIERNKQSKGAKGQDDIAYHFTFEKKVKKIYVSSTVQEHLTAGRLLIVGEGETFELVPRVIADKIAERNPAMVVQPPENSSAVDEDDPYAGYEIPDDLMW